MHVVICYWDVFFISFDIMWWCEDVFLNVDVNVFVVMYFELAEQSWYRQPIVVHWIGGRGLSNSCTDFHVNYHANHVSVCLDVQETSSNGFGLSWQPCREIYSGSNLSVAYHIQSIYLFGWIMMLGSLLLFRADFICINTLTSSSLRRSRCLMSLLKHLGIWV